MSDSIFRIRYGPSIVGCPERLSGNTEGFERRGGVWVQPRATGLYPADPTWACPVATHAFASLRSGEVVVDCGSAGTGCLLAGEGRPVWQASGST